MGSVKTFEVCLPTAAAMRAILAPISGKLTLFALWIKSQIGDVSGRLLCYWLLARHRPDAVFCANHGHQELIWAMMDACGRRGVPAATYLLGMPDAFEVESPERQRMLDESMWDSARFVVVNARAVGVSHSVMRGLPADKLTVVPNGIPLVANVGRVRSQTGKLRIGTLGRLSRLKGVHDLIEAAAVLERSGLDLDLSIAGEGPEADSLRRQVERAGLHGRVRFVGFVSDDQVHTFLSELDVFVLASLTEGLPFAVIEAMRAGLPVVATSVGGVPELVHDGVTGLLVEPADPQGIANAILCLNENRDLAARMGRLGRERFETHYTTQVMHEALRREFVCGGLTCRRR